MDPFYEQRLRDEVLYLHSLWHQGPSRNPNPNPNPTHNPSRHLQLSKPKKFKKRGKKKSKKTESNPLWVSDIEWPCKPPSETPSLSASGWPVLKLPSAPTNRPPTAQEQARLTATQLHQKALKATQDFFASTGNDDDDEDEGSGDDDDDSMEEDTNREYDFFLKVFNEECELRGYYEKSWEGGDFSCLVCNGIGKKIGKRFRDCVALVQHSITIARTKKKRAHRAYAQVMCKVLGWDINRLPTIVLSLKDSQGNAEAGTESLDMVNQNSGSGSANNGEVILKEVSNVELHSSLEDPQGNAEVGTGDLNMVNQNSCSGNVNNAELILKEVSNVELHSSINSTSPDMSNVVGDNVMLCESSLTVCDANKCLENLDNGDLNMAEGKAEGGVVNCLSCLKVRDANECMGNLHNTELSTADGKTEGVVNCLEPCNNNGIGKEMKVVNDLDENNGNQN